MISLSYHTSPMKMIIYIYIYNLRVDDMYDVRYAFIIKLYSVLICEINNSIFLTY